jgi:hypothetical protein
MRMIADFPHDIRKADKLLSQTERANLSKAQRNQLREVDDCLRLIFTDLTSN